MTIAIHWHYLLSGLPNVMLSTHGGPAPFSFEWILSTNVINIVLTALLLGFFIKKFNLFAIFDTQQTAIQKDVTNAESEKTTALSELDDVKQRTANLQNEIQSILAQATRSAETLSDKILEDAEQEAQRIVETSKKRAESEQRMAAKSLEVRLLKDALNDTREKLGHLPQNEQSRSIEDFIKELPQLKQTAEKV